MRHVRTFAAVATVAWLSNGLLIASLVSELLSEHRYITAVATFILGAQALAFWLAFSKAYASGRRSIDAAPGEDEC